VSSSHVLGHGSQPHKQLVQYT